MTKINLIPNKEVSGNLQQYRQLYSIDFLQKNKDNNEKLVLNITTDMHNSLRFGNEVQLKEFIADMVYSIIIYKELRINPQFKESFRKGQLQGLIESVAYDVLTKFNKESLKYQKVLII